MNGRLCLLVHASLPIQNVGDGLHRLMNLSESPVEKWFAWILAMTSVIVVCDNPEVRLVVQAQYELPALRYRLDWLVQSGERKVAFEVDGFAYHGDRQAFTYDRKRDRLLAATGIETFRFSAHEVIHQPYQVMAEVNEILERFALQPPQAPAVAQHG